MFRRSLAVRLSSAPLPAGRHVFPGNRPWATCSTIGVRAVMRRRATDDSCISVRWLRRVAGMLRTGGTRALIGLLLPLVLSRGTVLAGDAPTDVVLGPDTWEQARGLMPDEFLAAYQRGDYRHRIAKY